MKYLKRFESLFGPDVAKIMPGNEWVEKIRSLGRDSFSKSESKTLTNLMEKSGRKGMGEEEWENIHWDRKINKFLIHPTYLSFYTNEVSTNDNPNPYGVDITKCKDGWFFASFYQEGWDDIDYDEKFYECDGFDCLLDLLKKEAKLG